MNLGVLGRPGRALCLLTFLGALVLSAAGCGNSAGTTSGGDTPIPKNVQESNKNMQDFMNSKKK